MTEEPKEFGARSLEAIVRAFEVNYDIYSRDLRETGLVEDPAMLFAKEKDEARRAALLAGAAAFFSLPESIGERMRLIVEARKNNTASPFSEAARKGLSSYGGAPREIRQELGLDWRNVIIRALNNTHSDRGEALAEDQLRRSFREKFEKMLDKVFLVLPLVGKESTVKDAMNLVKKAPAYELISTDDELNLRAYLGEFYVEGERSDK